SARARTVRTPGVPDAPRRVVGHGRPSRRGGRLQGARPRATAGLRSRRRHRRVNEGIAVRVALVDYGAGNLRSVCSALWRAGAEPRVTRDAAAVLDAPLALIAGVGNAASAARALESDGL